MSPITRSKRDRGDGSETDEDIVQSKRRRSLSTSSDSEQDQETKEGNSDDSILNFSRRRRRRRGGYNLQERTCNICKRVFKKVAHLRDHLAIHDPNRPKYRCSHPNCDKEYNEVKNWRTHFLKHHTNGPKCQKKKKLKQFETKLKKVSDNF